MSIGIRPHTHPHLVSLFILMLKEGIDPGYIIIGIYQLAKEQQDSFGMNVSIICFLHCFDLTSIGNNCEGISDFIRSLLTEGITSSVLLDALYYACYTCGVIKFANLIDGACQTVYKQSAISNQQSAKTTF